MIVKCAECRDLICDFCRFYCFNGEWQRRRNHWVPVYIETGFCWVTMLPCDPDDECDCDSFYCFRADIKEGIK